MKLNRDQYDSIYNMPGDTAYAIEDKDSGEVFVFYKDEAYKDLDKLGKLGLLDDITEEEAMDPDYCNLVNIFYFESKEQYNEGQGKATASTDDIHVLDLEDDIKEHDFYSMSTEEKYVFDAPAQEIDR